MNGVLLIDKPAGITSHDVVARVRQATGLRRVGHTGTLDPFATGLLLVCLGRATRLSRYLAELSKSYEATIFFGYATDTYDRTGAPTTVEQEFHAERAELEQQLESFVGRIKQRPPAFSAKKVGGKRLYQLARAGVAVSPAEVEVVVHEITFLELRGSEARVRVTVSSGTYVRSLAHDLGQRVGCGAHLRELRRTAVASFSVTDALEIDRVAAESVRQALLSPSEALRDMPSVRVDSNAARLLSHGRALAWEDLGTVQDIDVAADRIRVLGAQGELLAIGSPDRVKGALRPMLVWSDDG